MYYVFYNLTDNGKLYAPCGIYKDAFSSPDTNLAKADNQKTLEARPHGVYSML
jgi:hypothetical protein